MPQLFFGVITGEFLSTLFWLHAWRSSRLFLPGLINTFIDEILPVQEFIMSCFVLGSGGPDISFGVFSAG